MIVFTNLIIRLFADKLRTTLLAYHVVKLLVKLEKSGNRTKV